MACGTCEDCIEKTKSLWSEVKVEKCKFFKKDAAFLEDFFMSMIIELTQRILRLCVH